MRAFHGDALIKAKYIARVEEHMRLDQVVQGTGWDPATHRGCAVGCTLDAYDHTGYPDELGIQLQIAHLQDRMHELQTVEDAKVWPLKFLSAITPGADLSGVWARWAVWALVDDEWGVIRAARTDRTREVVQRVADLYRNGGTAEEFRQVRRDAAAAAAAWRMRRDAWAVAARDKLLEILAQVPA